MVDFFVVVLAAAGLIDAISWMVVTPSLIFYVTELGSIKEAYGLTLSAFSFASFITKPLLGWLSDQRGFRFPFLISFAIAAAGGLFYFLASANSFQNWAIPVLVASRLMGGVGGGNSALGYAYMARAIPLEEQTATNTILSLMRILGMSLGPFLNAFLAGVDCTIFGMEVTQLNSVGLVVMFLNIVACLLIYFFLEDLPVRRDRKLSVSQYEIESVKDDSWDMLKAFFTLEILVPFFCTFVYNANFQLIETAFAPAAHHALGWGTVETSGVLGSVSVIIAGCMFLVYVLSKNYKVVDEMLMGMGLVFSVIAYTFLYFSWKDEAAAWHFWFPVVLSAAAFPFISAPTISVFTKHVEHKPALQPHHGTMQAILGMSASIAGFVTPSVVAIYILRHPDQVDASEDHRELTPLGLYAPIISLVNLIGLLYVEFVKRPLANPTLPKYKPEASPMYVRRPIRNKTLVSSMGERTPLFVPLNDVSESDYTIADDDLPRMRFLQGGSHLMADITTSGGRGTFMLSTMQE